MVGLSSALSSSVSAALSIFERGSLSFPTAMANKSVSLCSSVSFCLTWFDILSVGVLCLDLCVVRSVRLFGRFIPVYLGGACLNPW